MTRRPSQPRAHVSGGQLEIPLQPRRSPEVYSSGRSLHHEIESSVMLLARSRLSSKDPKEISIEIAQAIGSARAGGKEKVFGRKLRGLARLSPSFAGEVYVALIDPKGRRDLGAFYTPPDIARRLVRLALAGRSDCFIIDPSCGSGAFLLEAARVLERRLGDPDQAARRLYGIDKDRGALEICKAVLGAHGYRLPDENLLAADALLTPWPRPPGRAGFDAVVGNPPYRNIVRLPETERRALKRRYGTFRNKCDLYALFIEASARHLVPGGRLALLVSDSFLGTSSFAPLRRLLFGGEGIRTRIVEQIFGSAFKDASVKVVALISERPRFAKGLVLDQGEDRDPTLSSQLLLAPRTADEPPPGPARTKVVRFSRVTPQGRRLSSVTVTQEELRVQCETSAAIPADPSAMELARTMRAAGVPLCELARVVLGVKTGADARFVVEGEIRPDGAHFVPCIRGREVAPFRVVGPGAWLDYRVEELRAVHGARPRVREHFDRPDKLLLRETSGARLIAAYDAGRRFPLDTLHVVLEREGSGASLWYLLAVLNSGPASFWYGLHHPGPHVKASEVRALPVPPPLPSRDEESRAAIARAFVWIGEAASGCSTSMSEETRAGEERPAVPSLEIPSVCREPAARTALLETLARLLSEELEPGAKLRAQALLDDLVASAYRIAGPAQPHQGKRR